MKIAVAGTGCWNIHCHIIITTSPCKSGGRHSRKKGTY